MDAMQTPHQGNVSNHGNATKKNTIIHFWGISALICRKSLRTGKGWGISEYFRIVSKYYSWGVSSVWVVSALSYILLPSFHFLYSLSFHIVHYSPFPSFCSSSPSNITPLTISFTPSPSIIWTLRPPFYFLYYIPFHHTLRPPFYFLYYIPFIIH